MKLPKITLYYCSLDNLEDFEVINLQTTDPIRWQITTPPADKVTQTRIIIPISDEMKKLFKN
jgi:hypothetical protein